MVLVGRNGDERRLREDVRAEGRVFGAEAVVLIRLHDVDPRLILVHGIEDDLANNRKKKQIESAVRYLRRFQKVIKNETHGLVNHVVRMNNSALIKDIKK